MDIILDVCVLIGLALLMPLVYVVMDVLEFAVAQLFGYLRFKLYTRPHGK